MKNDEMKVDVDKELAQQVKGAAVAAASKTPTTKVHRLVGAIDQGTSSTRFVVFTGTGRILASGQCEFTQIFADNDESKVGWHEHNPIEIWESTMNCIDAVTKALEKEGIILSSSSSSSSTKSGGAAGLAVSCKLAALGITNQRETTVAWNRVTGIPYYNAIVWDDLRTSQIAAAIAKGNPDRLRAKTGLPLASYFAGTKVKWLLDNVPEITQDLNDPNKASQVCFGTIDSWLIYQLTGKPSSIGGNVGGIFCTDVTNASRWLFMDLYTLQWDQKLVDTVCAPHTNLSVRTALPKICPSSHIYAVLEFSHSAGSKTHARLAALNQVPLAAVLGDQQAALFGQAAFSPGKAKNTYGTGLFLMMNTGPKPTPSKHGCLTTVAYQLGTSGQVQYALEGSVSHSGSTIQWLRDKLQIIASASESEKLATTHNDGLYLVPAFAGLFAPYWRSDARACIVGMTATHHKGHVCRAALEATAYQTREVFDAIVQDSKVELKSLNVDGGGTHNKLLMQFQADIINVPVLKPVVMETTSMGAAFAAGLAVQVWDNVQEIAALWEVAERFEPKMTEQERNRNWKGWKKAVSRSLGWVVEKEDDTLASALSRTATTAWRATPILALVAAGAATVGFLLGKRSPSQRGGASY